MKIKMYLYKNVIDILGIVVLFMYVWIVRPISHQSCSWVTPSQKQTDSEMFFFWAQSLLLCAATFEWISLLFVPSSHKNTTQTGKAYLKIKQPDKCLCLHQNSPWRILPSAEVFTFPSYFSHENAERCMHAFRCVPVLTFPQLDVESVAFVLQVGVGGRVRADPALQGGGGGWWGSGDQGVG